MNDSLTQVGGGMVVVVVLESSLTFLEGVHQRSVVVYSGINRVLPSGIDVVVGSEDMGSGGEEDADTIWL